MDFQSLLGICFLNIVGLVHEDCIAKMRLMSLVDLGSDETGQIPYSLIRDTLRVCLLNLSASPVISFASWLTCIGAYFFVR